MSSKSYSGHIRETYFVVVSDADVMSKHVARYFLFHLYEGCTAWDIKYSGKLLREVQNTLVNKLRVNRGAAKQQIAEIRERLPHGEIQVSPVEFLNYESDKDAYVVETVINSNANILVSDNPKDFREYRDSIEFELLTFDGFLNHTYILDPWCAVRSLVHAVRDIDKNAKKAATYKERQSLIRGSLKMIGCSNAQNEIATDRERIMKSWDSYGG